MAKGRKTGGKDFQPGQSGNPNGRPPLPADIKEMRPLNRLECERALTKYLRMSMKGLRLLIEDESLAALDLITIRVILEAHRLGDFMRFDFLLNRLIGKVKDNVEISLPRPTIIKRKDGSEVVLGAKIENEEDEE